MDKLIKRTIPARDASYTISDIGTKGDMGTWKSFVASRSRRGISSAKFSKCGDCNRPFTDDESITIATSSISNVLLCDSCVDALIELNEAPNGTI